MANSLLEQYYAETGTAPTPLKKGDTNLLEQYYKETGVSGEQGRKSYLQEAKEAVGDIAQGFQASGPVDFLGKAPKRLMGALRLAGIPGMAAERTIASGIRGLEKNPIEGLKGAYRGITGQESTQYGDVLRDFGANPLAADIVGLAGAAVTDPTAMVSKGARVAAMGKAKHLAQKTGETINEVITRGNPKAAQHLLNTGYRALAKPARLNPKAGVEPEIKAMYQGIQNTVDGLHSAATTAFEGLKDVNYKQVINPSDLGAIQADVVNALGNDLDPVVQRFVRKVGALGSSTSSTILGPTGTAIQAAAPVTVGELVALAKGISPRAKVNGGLAKGVDAIMTNLKAYDQDIADASSKWQQYSRLQDHVDNLFSPQVIKGAGAIPDVVVPGNTAKILEQFSTEPGNLASVPERSKMMAALLEQATGGRYKASELMDTIKDLASVSGMSSKRPGMLGASLAGYMGVAMSRIMNNPATQFMLGIGGMGATLMSSPKASVIINKAAYDNGIKLGKIMSIPAVKALTRASVMATDEGVAQMVTGRAGK
jgi:hypothetical protein